MNNGDISGVSTMQIRWGHQLTAPTANEINIQDTPEWARYSNLYKKFCVQGVSMKYKPYSFNMGTSNIISEELLLGSSIDGTALNATNIRLAVDFHCQKASRT